MNFKRVSAAAATTLLALGLAVGAPTAAQAKVSGKDVPSKSNITKIYPSYKSGEFATSTSRKVGVPGKKCGENSFVKARSARSLTASAGGTFLITGVAEMKSVAAAKGIMKKYKKYPSKCAKFTSSGIASKVKRDSVPKLGQDRVAYSTVTTFAGINGYGATILIRHGKRIAEVSTGGNEKVSKTKLRKLAKVAAKKMR